MGTSSSPSAKSGIELEQDLKFQERDWKVQRVAWFLMALVIVGALAGLWGVGALSSTTASATDAGFRVGYDRFVRFKAPTELRVHYGAAQVQGGEVRIALEREYLARLQPQQIVPNPRSVEVGEDRLTYVFDAESMQSGAVDFELQPQRIGRVSGRVTIGEKAVVVGHLVYP